MLFYSAADILSVSLVSTLWRNAIQPCLYGVRLRCVFLESTNAFLLFCQNSFSGQPLWRFSGMEKASTNSILQVENTDIGTEKRKNSGSATGGWTQGLWLCPPVFWLPSCHAAAATAQNYSLLNVYQCQHFTVGSLSCCSLQPTAANTMTCLCGVRTYYKFIILGRISLSQYLKGVKPKLFSGLQRKTQIETKDHF